MPPVLVLREFNPKQEHLPDIVLHSGIGLTLGFRPGHWSTQCPSIRALQRILRYTLLSSLSSQSRVSPGLFPPSASATDIYSAPGIITRSNQDLMLCSNERICLLNFSYKKSSDSFEVCVRWLFGHYNSPSSASTSTAKFL